MTAGGNGFVAAFVAGILFAAASRGELAEATSFTEDTGLFLSFFVWALFGAILVGPLVTQDIHPEAVIYAVLSLTLVRMVPVAVALVGTGLRPSSVAFMGWFGPRGLASVVFTLIAFESLQHAGNRARLADRGRRLDDPPVDPHPRGHSPPSCRLVRAESRRWGRRAFDPSRGPRGALPQEVVRPA